MKDLIPSEDHAIWHYVVLYIVIFGIISGLLYSSMSYKSYKSSYMLSCFALSSAIEAQILFDSPKVSLVFLVFSYGGVRVLDRNYISYFSD